MPAAQASAGSNASNPGSAGAATTTALSEGASKTQRLSNTTASLPIVYGSIAFYLGKKADELQTHEWTLFLRGPNKDEDHLNSTVISKVVFQLHPSFAQPTRELTEPPYEVTERGWGEFEAQIRIHWKDPTEQTTIVNHTIKLYPQGMPPAGTAKKDMVEQSTEKPVVAENYDEVVFTDPTESFFQSLTQVTALPPGALASEQETASFALNPKDGLKKSSRNSTGTKLPSSSNWKDHCNAVYSDREDFLALIAAQKFLKEELAGVKQKFALVTEELSVVDQKLLLAQQQKQREAAAVAVRGSSTTNERKRTKKGRSSGASGGPASKKARTSAAGSKSSAGGASTTPKRAAGTGRGQPKSGGKTASKAGASKKGTAGGAAAKK